MAYFIQLSIYIHIYAYVYVCVCIYIHIRTVISVMEWLYFDFSYVTRMDFISQLVLFEDLWPHWLEDLLCNADIYVCVCTSYMCWYMLCIYEILNHTHTHIVCVHNNAASKFIYLISWPVAFNAIFFFTMYSMGNKTMFIIYMRTNRYIYLWNKCLSLN